MRNYKGTRLSDDFVNMTDRVIHIYNQASGEIIVFTPSTQKLPPAPIEIIDGAKTIHYIFEPEDIISLEKIGRELDDIAIVSDESYGRNGIPIAHLIWGRNPNISVCLYEGLFRSSFPHL